MLLAGGAIAYHAYQENKLDATVEKLDTDYEMLDESQENLEVINDQLAQIEHGEAFIANWLKQTKDFDEQSVEVTPEE